MNKKNGRQLIRLVMESLSSKSNINHVHTKSELGISNVNNTSDMDKPISTATQEALDELYEQLTAYTNQRIANIINGAPSNLDTLKEISDALATHKTLVDALDAAITKKANAAEFDSHTKDTTKHITASERNNWNSANSSKHTHANKSIIDGISSTNINNWNAANSDRHTHSNKSVIDGISSSNISNWNGKLAPTGNGSDLTTAFSRASTRTNITSGEKLSVSLGKILRIFADILDGAASTLLGANLTADRVLVSNGSGKIAAGSVNTIELGQLAGATSNIQNQINIIDRLLTETTTKQSVEIASSFVQNGQVFISKVGRWAVLSFNRNKNALTGKTTYQVCTIPAAFRPISTWNVMIPIYGDISTGLYCVINDSTGAFTVQPSHDIASSGQVYARIIYITK